MKWALRSRPNQSNIWSACCRLRRSCSIRQINIDPGYLDALKLVLASTKNACQRIYLDQGIYAEATLLYYEGAFRGLAYTYRDFLWPQTLEFLLALRARYLQQLRAPV